MLPFMWLAAITVACILLPLWYLRSRQQKRRRAAAAKAGSRSDGGEGNAAWRSSYRDPLRWAFVPNGGVHCANTGRSEAYESDLCALRVVSIHRPTHEPWREETGEYPFAWHMAGRKRLWEIRLQIRFKQVPTSKVYFGITLGGFVPVSGLARQVQKMLIRACSVVGDVYHSNGDDPARVQGEAEPPTFVMPIWAFDQFIISEPGEEPNLCEDLEGLGMRRTDGIHAYIKAIKSTIDNFATNKVYTFSFWGASQFLDCMKWEICGGLLPGIRLDFNKLCGAPPVYVAMYEMPGHEAEADPRHLPSRKKCYFHVAMWSQRRPPRAEVLEDLLGNGAHSKPQAAASARAEVTALRGSGFSSTVSFLTCCTARSSPAKQSSFDGAADDAWLGG